VDQHVPSTRPVRTSKQEVLHYYRIVTRIFQRRYPLRATTRCCCRAAFAKKESLDISSLLTWMLVSIASLLLASATNVLKLHHPRRPSHRLRNQRLWRRVFRSNRCLLVARLLLSDRNCRRHHMLLRPQRLGSLAVATRTPLSTYRGHRLATSQIPNNEWKLLDEQLESSTLDAWPQSTGQCVCDVGERGQELGESGKFGEK
jgi:hypothetical protein